VVVAVPILNISSAGFAPNAADDSTPAASAMTATTTVVLNARPKRQRE
jgi:hypothetical protein